MVLNKWPCMEALPPEAVRYNLDTWGRHVTTVMAALCEDSHDVMLLLQDLVYLNVSNRCLLGFLHLSWTVKQAKIPQHNAARTALICTNNFSMNEWHNTGGPTPQVKTLQSTFIRRRKKNISTRTTILAREDDLVTCCGPFLFSLLA